MPYHYPPSSSFPRPPTYPHPLPLLPSFLPSLILPDPKLQLRLLGHGAHQQPILVLLQHALVVIFPELLAGVLARDALEDLGPAGVFLDEAFGAVSESACSAEMREGGRGGQRREGKQGTVEERKVTHQSRRIRSDQR